MKNLISLCFLFVVTASLTAQDSGEIHFIVKQKLEFKMDGAPGGVDLSGMLPSERVEDKVLVFNKEASVYYGGAEEEEETELSSDDGSFKMVLIESDIENRLYTDLKTQETFDQQGFMEKPFIVLGKTEKLKWKITTEKVKYLDYECIKATTTIEKDDEIKEVVAWFAPAIKFSVGPKEYGQLPGAILMLSIDGDKTEIKATKVTLAVDAKIEKPTDGKMVTEEEFEKIVDEKLKELEKEYGGSSGSGITIKAN